VVLGCRTDQRRPAPTRARDAHANVAVNADRPHSLVARAVDPMKRQTWSAWVSHVVEDNLLRCRLLEPAQPAEAAIEGLRNLKHGLSSRKSNHNELIV
jgi:hypothetical protein